MATTFESCLPTNNDEVVAAIGKSLLVHLDQVKKWLPILAERGMEDTFVVLMENTLAQMRALEVEWKERLQLLDDTIKRNTPPQNMTSLHEKVDQLAVDRASIEQLTKQVHHLELQVVKFESSLQVAKVEKEQIQLQLEGSQVDKSRLQVDLEAATTDKNQLGTQLEITKVDKGRLQVELNITTLEKEWLGTQLEVTQVGKGRLRAELEVITLEKERLGTQLEVTQVEKGRLQAELEVMTVEKKRLQADLEKGSGNVSLQSELRAATEALNITREEVKTHGGRFQEVHERLKPQAALESQLQLKVKELAVAQEKIVEKEGISVQLQATVEALQYVDKENENLNTEIQTLIEDLGSAREDMQEQVDLLEQSEAALEVARNEIDRQAGTISVLEQREQNASEVEEELRLEIESKRTEVETAREVSRNANTLRWELQTLTLERGILEQHKRESKRHKELYDDEVLQHQSTTQEVQKFLDKWKAATKENESLSSELTTAQHRHRMELGGKVIEIQRLKDQLAAATWEKERSPKRKKRNLGHVSLLDDEEDDRGGNRDESVQSRRPSENRRASRSSSPIRSVESVERDDDVASYSRSNRNGYHSEIGASGRSLASRTEAARDPQVESELAKIKLCLGTDNASDFNSISSLPESLKKILRENIASYFNITDRVKRNRMMKLWSDPLQKDDKLRYCIFSNLVRKAPIFEEEEENGMQVQACKECSRKGKLCLQRKKGIDGIFLAPLAAGSRVNKTAREVGYWVLT